MKVINSYQKLREDWFEWTISIEANDIELGQVSYVTYNLPDSLPKRQLVSRDRTRNFARSGTSWREFRIEVYAFMRNGEIRKASYWLNLGFDRYREEKAKYSGEFKEFARS